MLLDDLGPCQGQLGSASRSSVLHGAVQSSVGLCGIQLCTSEESVVPGQEGWAPISTLVFFFFFSRILGGLFLTLILQMRLKASWHDLAREWDWNLSFWFSVRWCFSCRCVVVSSCLFRAVFNGSHQLAYLAPCSLLSVRFWEDHGKTVFVIKGPADF